MHVHERVSSVAVSVLHMLWAYEPLQSNAGLVPSELKAAAFSLAEVTLRQSFLRVPSRQRRASVIACIGKQ